MYSTGHDRIPSKPVITSLAQATKEIETWMRENNLSSVLDQDGMSWRLNIQTKEIPTPSEPKKHKVEMTFQLSAEATATDFEKTGTLKRSDDARLIELLGTKKVPLRMRPYSVLAESQQEARTLFVQHVTDLRKKMASQSMHDIKRLLIGRFVDESALFV